MSNKLTDKDRNLLSLEQVAIDQFKDSVHYTVVTKAGVARFHTKYYRTYPEAMVIALHTEVCCVYAVDRDNHSLLIPPEEYELYLNLYNELSGQRLRMPFQPKINPPTKSKRKKYRG